MSRRLIQRTALLSICERIDREIEEAERMPLPAPNLRLLVRRGTNPRKQRKGKSGEIARKAGK